MIQTRTICWIYKSEDNNVPLHDEWKKSHSSWWKKKKTSSSLAIESNEGRSELELFEYWQKLTYYIID